MAGGWTTLVTSAAFAAWLGLGHGGLFPAEPHKPVPSSLDQQLLRDLEDELMDDLKKPDAGDSQAKEEKPEDPLDRRLLEDLRDSPDEGRENPLELIGHKMRRAQTLIHRQQTSEPTQQLQREIVADIDKLLDQARRQIKRSSSSSSRQQVAQRDRPSQPQGQSQDNQPGDQQSNQPARDSQAGMQEAAAAKPQPLSQRQLVQQLWGHLPQRERQQVINSTIEKFIPKYELLTEEYFKRLMEKSHGR
jgi:hypothetical protein